jgi:hypothetical protein
MGTIERDELIENVKHGLMTPEAAEAEAARLGLARLASEPDGNAFDPMSETWWSLPMTVAWIAWRTPEKVRAYWDKYRRECWDWHYRDWRIGSDGPVHSGFFLEQRRNASLWFMQRDETNEAGTGIWPHQTCAADAERKLRAVLEEGVIEATGINIATGRHMVIPRLEWQDLQMFQERDREVLRNCECHTFKMVDMTRSYSSGRRSRRCGRHHEWNTKATAACRSLDQRALVTCRFAAQPTGSVRKPEP